MTADWLDRLHNYLEDVAVENVEMVTIPDGTRQPNVDLDGEITVSPEEHEMKGVLVEYRDVLIGLVDAHEEDWMDEFDEHGVDDRRREQLRAVARRFED